MALERSLIADARLSYNMADGNMSDCGYFDKTLDTSSENNGARIGEEAVAVENGSWSEELDDDEDSESILELGLLRLIVDSSRASTSLNDRSACPC